MVSILRSDIRQAREALGNPARPWERTGSLDVEQLVAWAYGQQMVDRFERSGLHTIEAAAAGHEPSSFSTDGVGQLMQIEHLGCRIDRSKGIVSDSCHPVALAVASAVGASQNAGAVRRHARSATRPVQWVRPDRFARARIWVKEWEKAQVEYQGPGRKGAFCSVIILWDREREQWGRAEYSAWWEGLSQVAWKLSMRALGFTVTGPAAPATPWLEDERARPSSISLDESVPGHPPHGSSQPPPTPMGCGSAGGGGF